MIKQHTQTIRRERERERERENKAWIFLLNLLTKYFHDTKNSA